MTTIHELKNHLTDHFGSSQFSLDELDSLGWVSLVAYLRSKGIKINLSLLPSVYSIDSLYQIIEHVGD